MQEPVAPTMPMRRLRLRRPLLLLLLRRLRLRLRPRLLLRPLRLWRRLRTILVMVLSGLSRLVPVRRFRFVR